MNQVILNSINEASKVIGKTWPLYTFVASNPLSGYEDASFEEAVSSAQKHFNANAFPAARLYRQAWEKGDIDKKVMISLLKANGLSETPEVYLKLLESQKSTEELNGNHAVDRIMAKWLSAFLDEGLAEWDMPYRSEGFYTAWRLLVIYDSEMGTNSLKEIPKTSAETLEQLLKDYPETDYTKLFTHHLAALPGWTGYINHRTQSNSDWQKDFPIDLMDYLAARLWTAHKLNVPILPEKTEDIPNDLIPKLQHLWLQAWEQSWQNQLVKTLENGAISTASKNAAALPDAQMVFCIDTRSELIRRHVESKGNYETFGYAGFFGIAMDYQSLNDGITRKSCPPILASAYTVSETAQADKKAQFLAYGTKNELIKFADYFLKRMKNMLPSAFGYVEGSGFYYGLSLMARTLAPGLIYRKNQKNASHMEATCQPNINRALQEKTDAPGIPLEEKVGIVKSAFDLMGWKQFAPLVLFVGHGSHSANNPFSSSLDCGACAASPGRHNARMLAKLANLPEVRDALAKTHDILIPEATLFLGAEHNTTTDDIVLFDSEAPESHGQLIKNLKSNLSKAQQTATQNRLGSKGNSVSTAQQKANDWGETRPEWGLSQNAGFIVAPRHLTKHTNLDSRCFLHSYDWELDISGTSLEGIMQGPMVVTQWINNHYYFSTVDNSIFGGGSKITHNITGKFGVVQGNGGDLKMGLPLQSLYLSDDAMYHQPLRLSVMIQAPISRVSKILARNSSLKTLLDNEWIYLMVMDPKQNNEIYRYKKSIQWISTSENKVETNLVKIDISELATTEITM
ncbi:DUF2309 domain-containing protein [Subsaximicrobium wynnwilliamsii]|uniref:Probable inorganic carbon transporter subunit DabA n=1 Tax=Subsaximicrobium wynnwilliamsii TaxID=291179 RepID=A0A5C6ZIS6_9FLAO|nr:DUF2309 domain-containing protein [Subsaximicrobium wynnwilliamsii]TXD84447.1 DUF2309 domain-containing protein [Subsaximicrobium wynnwilliamsii]TXD90128.1 DUF2309 domain-containing protein [Subsaximicrobium wynnwilliamsii]TXE04180.1 DUF2309 domain-containing protein [Subsaximicrobium wynnwilliamsii]